MARDYSAYKRLLLALLPRGRAWRSGDPTLEQLFDGKAVELARVDTRVDDLFIERDTRTANELLAEHEAELGLVTNTTVSAANRRLRANAKLQTLGSLHKSYYIAVAEVLGWTITITEYTPAWCGLAVCGDPCGAQANVFHWRVNIAIDSPRFLGILADGSYYADGSYFADGVGEPTTYEDLIALIELYKPAHTVVHFAVVGPAFSNGFSSGFDAMPESNTIGGFDSGFNNGFNSISA